MMCFDVWTMWLPKRLLLGLLYRLRLYRKPWVSRISVEARQAWLDQEE